MPRSGTRIRSGTTPDASRPSSCPASVAASGHAHLADLSHGMAPDAQHPLRLRRPGRAQGPAVNWATARSRAAKARQRGLRQRLAPARAGLRARMEAIRGEMGVAQRIDPGGVVVDPGLAPPRPRARSRRRCARAIPSPRAAVAAAAGTGPSAVARQQHERAGMRGMHGIQQPGEIPLPAPCRADAGHIVDAGRHQHDVVASSPAPGTGPAFRRARRPLAPTARQCTAQLPARASAPAVRHGRACPVRSMPTPAMIESPSPSRPSGMPLPTVPWAGPAAGGARSAVRRRRRPCHAIAGSRAWNAARSSQGPGHAPPRTRARRGGGRRG